MNSEETYLTYQEWQEHGRQVKRGERASIEDGKHLFNESQTKWIRPCIHDYCELCHGEFIDGHAIAVAMEKQRVIDEFEDSIVGVMPTSDHSGSRSLPLSKNPYYLNDVRNGGKK